MPSFEVETSSILNVCFTMQKKIYVPKIIGKCSNDMQMLHVRSQHDLKTCVVNAWGIPEPSLYYNNIKEEDHLLRGNVEDECDVDLILVPGVAFDVHGNRCGHGKGYYDAFFQRLQKVYAERNLVFPITMVNTYYYLKLHRGAKEVFNLTFDIGTGTGRANGGACTNDRAGF